MIKNIALIGGGRMAEGIISGLCDGPLGAAGIHVGEPDADRRAVLSRQYNIHCSADNAEVTRDADIIVLAIKPQVAAGVCADLQVTAGQTVVSIMAGVTIAAMRRWMGEQADYARAMPNTPALLGKGITGLYMPPQIGAERRQLVHGMLESLGPVLEVTEETAIDAVTAISGSGPAYYFAFTEALQQAGLALGLSADDAASLACQTVIGAAAMVEQTGNSPSQLREQVTSPGGTTAAALNSFADSGLPEIVARAAAAAHDRAAQLARELDTSPAQTELPQPSV